MSEICNSFETFVWEDVRNKMRENFNYLNPNPNFDWKDYVKKRIYEWFCENPSCIKADLDECIFDNYYVGCSDMEYDVFKILNDEFEFDEEVFCKRLIDVYCTDGYDHTYDHRVHKQYREWFSKYDRRYMNEDDKKFYDELGEDVDVFRGCSIEEAKKGITSLSWTTDFKTALFFAFRYRTKGRCVLQSKVKKDKIVTCIEGRNESECIITDPIDYKVLVK